MSNNQKLLQKPMFYPTQRAQYITPTYHAAHNNKCCTA